MAGNRYAQRYMSVLLIMKTMEHIKVLIVREGEREREREREREVGGLEESFVQT